MEQQTPDKETRVRVGISHGDINGISYEIILKTLQDQYLLDTYTVIVYGSSKVASYYRKIFEVNDFNFNIIKRAEQAHPKRANIINIIDDEVRIEMGQITQIAGELAFRSLEMAMDDLLKGNIDVLVTAPINKKNIQSDQFRFPGHTEYLTSRCKADDSLMLMVSNDFRIGVVTGHIPLSLVPSTLTTNLILQKIHILHDTLVRDFNIVKPRIALLALNPHAGDDGLIGEEDQKVIRPAIEKAFQNGLLVFGPYPADGLFGSSSFREFDGILAMYHDQGMVPFKLLSFGDGVNYTAGLPVIRTSPAHGTAFDITGKNEANPDSFRHALYLACDVFLNRTEHDELIRNQLKTGKSDEPKAAE